MVKENKTNERQRIVLAALLHDIGKFWQRADEKIDKSVNLKQYYDSKNESYDITVPLYENRNPKYVHALWTNAFFEMTKTGNKLNLNLENDKTLVNLSANHHKPNNHAEAIVALADRWSSGIDRPDEGEEGVSGYKEVKDMFGKDFVRKVAMHSIFDTIEQKIDDIQTNHTYKIAPLELDKDILFPIERNLKNLHDDYKKVWNDFMVEYNALLKKTENFNSFYTSLLALLKKYTWCIPSATNVLPANVSLFEHLKSSAAIALSLYDYCENNKHIITVNENNSINNLPEKDSLLMVCVDVSGIQKFIYDIANKKAAASLKGRSFFIELLIQNIIDEIIDNKRINAYKSNVIYSSGGKAYLILPNTETVKTELENIQKEIETKLYRETDGQLFVAIGYTSFRYQSTVGKNSEGKIQFINQLLTDEKEVLNRYEKDDKLFDLSMLWRSVSDKAAERKNRKFESVYKNQYDELFLKGEDFEQSIEKCSVTGNKIIDRVYYLDEHGENTVPVSKLVYDQVEIGKDLRESNSIAYHSEGKYSTFGLGDRFSLYERHTIENAKRIYLNKWPRFDEKKGANGHMFYGGNYQPQIENRSKTFEELCKINEKDDKTTKLAVLRMDVDNLGQIFISGIKNKSFASYATLSMMLDTFFAGYINAIQLNNELFKKHIQILYSGGDDVFAVGRWDAIIDFASKIRESFRQYVKRDDITISAGISIVNAKYPISKAAQDAGNAEDSAKKHISINDKEKNAIDLFGQTIGWDEEWQEVVSLKHDFEYFGEKIGKSLLHTIQNAKLKKDENTRRKNRGESEDLSYIWHSAYQLSRMIERLDDKKHKSAIEFVKDLMERILRDRKFHDKFIDIAAVAARWAEYYLKEFN